MGMPTNHLKYVNQVTWPNSEKKLTNFLSIKFRQIVRLFLNLEEIPLVRLVFSGSFTELAIDPRTDLLTD